MKPGPYGCYEIALTSDDTHLDPVHDVAVAVAFRCGDRRRTVDAFWDGGTTWRARIAPDVSGEWTWRSTCSDISDGGLHGRTGRFVFESGGEPDAQRHPGPLAVASEKTHFVRDGKPFFWLADTAWSGPLKASAEEWERYLADRSGKGFNAIQIVMTHWLGACGDAEGRPAYLGREKIKIQPEFFQRLDQRVQAIHERGLIAAGALAWAADWNADSRYLNPGVTLSETELVLLVRYIVARYGCYNVVWMLAGDGSYHGEEAERWRRVGRAGFIHNTCPVTMHPAGMQWVDEEFSGEPWFSFNCYQSGHWVDDTNSRWITAGPPSQFGSTRVRRPSLNFEACYEGHVAIDSDTVVQAWHVRRASYWSLLAGAPCGITYGAHGIWSWEHQAATPLSHPKSGVAMPWNEAMHLPGSASMTYVKRLFESIDWWRLRPSPSMLEDQPGSECPSRFVSAACTDARDQAVIYAPQGSAVKVSSAYFKPGIEVSCFDPATGVLLWKTDSLGGWEQLGGSSEGDRVFVLRGRQLS